MPSEESNTPASPAANSKRNLEKSSEGKVDNNNNTNGSSTKEPKEPKESKAEKTSNGDSGKKKSSSSAGEKKASRKDKKEAKATRRGNKMSDKMTAELEELEREGVGEGELVFNSTPGQKVMREDFELMTLIGKGSFGKVMQVRKRDTQQIYAMKVLRKEAIIARKQVTHTQAEKAILAKIQHPFIVKLHYAFQTKEKLYMILDYINGGELFFHLKREGRFPEERVRFYAAEIISAISHLHSLDIVYRDLKPENILLDREGHVVITDFGLSKEIDQDEGTHTFCVPESHELLTSRGFMDLDAYMAAAQTDPTLLVASYDKNAKSLVFERPLALVQYTRAARQLVELTDADSGVSMLVTRDHDLFVQHNATRDATDGSLKMRRNKKQQKQYKKTKASAIVDARDASFDAVRQLAVAEAGVAGVKAAPLPFAAALGLDTPAKLARFFELYGFAVGSAADELHFDALSADNAAWLVDTVKCFGIKSWSRRQPTQIEINERSWLEVVGSTERLAAWVWSLDVAALRQLLAGVRRAGQFSTASATLRDELVRVCLMAGYSAHFEAAADAGSWTLSIAEPASDKQACAPTLFKQRGAISQREYDGRVWCFTMPSGFVWVRSAEKDASGVVQSASRAILTGNCGTPEYLAPEVLKGQGHGMGVDWWSLGTLLFEMMTGLPPFFSQNINIMYQKILNGELKFPSHMSPEAQSLLSGFLTRDPEQRLGSRETGGEIKIKQHPWFAVYDWDKLDRKEIPPPWVPEVSDELDVGQIDSTFTAEAPTDSPENDSPIGGAAKGGDVNFTGFTYQPDSVLDS